VGKEFDWGNFLAVTHLYVVAEGVTEINFVRDVLAPYLDRRRPEGIAVEAPNLQGKCAYGEVGRLVRKLLRNLASGVRVTKMIDLYGLRGEFPGHAECMAYDDPWRVAEMERLIYEDIQDERVIPYLQLHEFEALILTDVGCLAKYYPGGKQALDKLAKSIQKDFKSPEAVNRMTPPSRRIRTAVPEYQKSLFGASAVGDLGLERIRATCKPFDSWLRKLEMLS
jgi:Domain of unknown function (DUF4276)